MRISEYDIKKMYEWPLMVQLIVLAAISLLLIYFGYLLDLAPFQRQLNVNAQQIEDIHRQYKLMVNKQVVSVNDINQLPALQKKLALWQKNIATKADLPVLVNDILNFGQDNQLIMEAFKPQKDLKDGIYVVTPVNVKLIGTYDQIAAFMSQIANMTKLVVIHEFILTRNVDNNVDVATEASQLNSDAILSAELTIDIYRQ